MSIHDTRAAPALCRGGKCLRIDSKAGRHYVRQHPDGVCDSNGEFAIIAFGYGGGYYDSYRAPAYHVKRLAERAGEDGITDGSMSELWPDDYHMPERVIR